MIPRTLFAALPVTLLLAACTPPPDSPTRMGAAGPLVQLSDPRTCLNRECLLYDARLGRVQQPGREMIRLPEGMADADGFISARDFQHLLDRTRAEPTVADGNDGAVEFVTRGRIAH
ncbi:hypothetical protein [Rhodobaculum claviforme]|uniref:Lipoprotein n=1 Tax=Rhodobaculum claviforme TaxID=1549854 RepID=A0A934TKS9_9RHOB|nr:hypothetical protein [Rhodobaculum claviforme]MBK5927266.1 hypothetical protein [Rhodobaculum claviforme]